ncbi:C39 family peptidase [Intestinimonas massiliensis (ex Afouda et al. 2020)]|uniref:C39 family peptidase n=1 Tax=Intestinimonas massiliensis (ex Afouda et al. 2020) TaxID=1673721 RepID=A0ABS9M7F4_9FIRM|nr:C39 family peptidase [Intestinimonas massiliensis (ex Afouda et al. 2020)]MCG4526446.1 C39 family peptidase [Intestinimonas massiliensis (ex Afouda et al. 2020)]
MNTEEENSVGYGMATLDKEPVPVVYYNQKDPQYGKLPFGTDIIETHGCGPTAMAMVVSSLTDRPMDPGQMAQWAYENGYWKKGKGALHDLIPAAAQAWGLDVAGYQAKDAGQVLAALEQKKLVVVLMWPGHFTASGHFIVLRGLDEDGKVVVADPSSQKRSEVSWDFQLIVDEAAEKAGANGPFWVIG